MAEFFYAPRDLRSSSNDGLGSFSDHPLGCGLDCFWNLTLINASILTERESYGQHPGIQRHSL